VLALRENLIWNASSLPTDERLAQKQLNRESHVENNKLCRFAFECFALLKFDSQRLSAVCFFSIVIKYDTHDISKSIFGSVIGNMSYEAVTNMEISEVRHHSSGLPEELLLRDCHQ
jgi:hypothetical protein